MIRHAVLLSDRTFCGRPAAYVVTTWDQVTCRSCRRVGQPADGDTRDVLESTAP